MRKKILQARFKGTDGSLGLKKGSFYDIEMEEFSGIDSKVLKVKIRISIKIPLCLNKICDYESFSSFLDNWTCIMVKS